MKQILTVIFSFFYLYGVIGVNINLHYCHGEVDSISLFTEHGSCVCDEVYSDRIDEMTCCTDINYKYELKDDQIFTSITSFNFELTEFVKTLNSTLDFQVYTNEQFLLEAFNLPPPKIIQNIPLRILHSVFRL